MTYKFNPSLENIQSPVVLIFPGGERREYIDGAAVVGDTFDQRFMVESLRAVENTVEIVLTEQKTAASTWISEEQTFF